MSLSSAGLKRGKIAQNQPALKFMQTVSFFEEPGGAAPGERSRNRAAAWTCSQAVECVQGERATVCVAVEWVRALNVSKLVSLPFLFPCGWHLELNYYLVKSKTNKQTNKQLGNFFPPSSALFPHSWPLFKAMLVTNLRA